jgi:hypothetical protein
MFCATRSRDKNHKADTRDQLGPQSLPPFRRLVLAHLSEVSRSMETLSTAPCFGLLGGETAWYLIDHDYPPARVYSCQRLNWEYTPRKNICGTLIVLIVQSAPSPPFTYLRRYSVQKSTNQNRHSINQILYPRTYRSLEGIS